MVKNKKGLTLIETLIVTTIIAIVSGLSLAQFRNVDKSRQVQGEAEKLADMLELASKKALAGEGLDLNNPNCSGTETGYRIEFPTSTQGEQQVELKIYCTVNASGVVTSQPTVFKNTLKNITLTHPNYITFKPISGGVVSDDTTYPIAITLSGASSVNEGTVNIDISSNGVVESRFIALVIANTPTPTPIINTCVKYCQFVANAPAHYQCAGSGCG